MVIHSHEWEMIKEKIRWQAKLCELPFEHKLYSTTTKYNKEKIHYHQNRQIDVCWGGSQRLRIADELGFTHIDCAIMPSLKRAHVLQRVMRRPYDHIWYN